MEKKLRLLLHSCCGPCSTAVIERLLGEYDITVFYYNPNITDDDEYEHRKSEQEKFLKKHNDKFKENPVKFLEGEYIVEDFFRIAKGYEAEKEGGERCNRCFFLRLNKTAEIAKVNGFDIFATTLTVSPHKNYKIISEIGKDIGNKCGVEFLDMDFKKKAGYQRSVDLSKEYDLYRQNYCGCEFSKWFLRTDEVH